MPYEVAKHYPHSLGLSACFRQHKAKSHCALMHGYALAFTFEYMADDLDECNWVIDFGGLKPLKNWLFENFDHRTLVARDDPKLTVFRALAHEHMIANINVVDATGCEAFARMAYREAFNLIVQAGLVTRVSLVRVTVAEHEGNCASYFEP